MGKVRWPFFAEPVGSLFVEPTNNQIGLAVDRRRVLWSCPRHRTRYHVYSEELVEALRHSGGVAWRHNGTDCWWCVSTAHADCGPSGDFGLETDLTLGSSCGDQRIATTIDRLHKRVRTISGLAGSQK